MSILSAGAQGASVAELQRRLQALGFTPGGVDGVFGPQTMQALAQYQTSINQPPTGSFDPATASAMDSTTPAGSTVAPTTVGGVAAHNPEEDPQFLAFERAQGYSEGELKANIAMKRSRLAEDYQNQMPIMAENNRNAMNNITSRSELNGTGNSGGTAAARLAQATSYGRDQSTSQLDLNRGNQDLSSDLLRQMAQNRMNTAEEGLAARSRLTSAAASASVPAYSSAALTAAATPAAPFTAGPQTKQPPLKRGIN